ncbi:MULTISPECIES: hypothetical protein [Empedobacter]|uniref:hypothetical protein n=1 Tax=Empedobacter TaxID=59734 RepID=UPI0025766CAC|nr:MULTISPECIES: hypothetical protein [Empedobacter]MDM1043206.1 hypothetical protein [Empedobacter brevis]MDM1137130.1 hypothetical protein [Empedobacter sp. R750]
MKQFEINRSTLFFLGIFAFIYIFPLLLLSNVYYADDVTRAINGNYWDHENRLMSNVIMKILSFDVRIKDFFPYTIIFSGIVFSISGYLVSQILKIEKNNTGYTNLVGSKS